MEENKFDTFEEFKIELSNSWIPVTSNKKIEDGPYLVTIANYIEHRKVVFGLFQSGHGWTLLTDLYDATNWKIIAYLPSVDNYIAPYEKPVMKFTKGDFIVWTHPKHKKMSWMVISSFDYQSDNAARALIGKNWYNDEVYTIYGDWVPNKFGDDCHIATNEEKLIIYDEMLNHFKNDYVFNKGTINERNVGYEVMCLTLKDYIIIQDILKNMWNNSTTNITND